MGFFIFILMIAGLIDQAIEAKRKPKSKKGVFLANKVAEYEQETARSEQKALSNRIHSISWDVETREAQEIKYEEVY